MKVSSAYLIKKLENVYEAVCCRNISGKDLFGRPVLNKIQNGHVLLFSEERVGEIKHFPEDVLLLVLKKESGDNPDETVVSCPYAVIETEETIEDVLNELQMIFDKVDEWEVQMGLEILREKGISGLLKTASDFLENPLTIIGPDGSLIRDAGTEHVDEKHRLFHEENINPQFMNHLLLQKGDTDQDSWPCIYPAFLDGCRTMVINMKVEQGTVFRLIMTEVRPFGEWDYCFLIMLKGFLLFSLSHMTSVMETSGLKDIFLTLLTDRTADYVQVSWSLSSMGWEVSHRYFCLILRNMYQENGNISNQGIGKYLSKHFRDSCSLEMEQDIVVFFNTDRLNKTQEEIERQLVYFIRDSYLKAGFSRSMHGHLNLRRQFLQAKTALEVGERVKPYQWIIRFDQIVLPYLLEQTVRTLPWYMISHEGVMKLKESDDYSHTEYIPTIKAFIEEHGSATAAANALFIHRSTFLYRMERIKAILKSNLDDPNELFYLDFSLRLMEQEEKKPGNKGNSGT